MELVVGEITDNKCGIFYNVLISVTWNAASGPSECEVGGESKRVTVL